MKPCHIGCMYRLRFWLSHRSYCIGFVARWLVHLLPRATLLHTFFFSTAVSESHESAGKDKVADKVETERPESVIVEPPKKRPVPRSARMYSKRKRKLLPKIASEESMTSRSSVSNVSDILGIKSLERLDRRGDFIISSEMIQQKEGIDRPKSRLGRPVPGKGCMFVCLC